MKTKLLGAAVAVALFGVVSVARADLFTITNGNNRQRQSGLFIISRRW
jgi:hypothetical protein